MSRFSIKEQNTTEFKDFFIYTELETKYNSLWFWKNVNDCDFWYVNNLMVKLTFVSSNRGNIIANLNIAISELGQRFAIMEVCLMASQ